MKKNSRLFHLSPRSAFLLGGLLLLAVTTTLFVYIEVTESRDELLEMVRTEASSLIEVLNRGGESTIRANVELEEALIERLIVSAKLIDHVNEHVPVSQLQLAGKANELDLAIVLLFDDDGRVIGSSQGAVTDSSTFGYREKMQSLIQPVLDDEYVWTADADVCCTEAGDRLFVVVHERRSHPGAIAVGIPSSTLLETRKRLGIGKLVQDIGKDAGISYIVLQDTEGILTATLGVQQMSSIPDDSILQAALSHDSVYTRILEYGDERVFEVVKSMHISDEQPVLSRIGLSLERVRGIQQRSMRRVIFIAIGFFVTAAILFIFLLLRKRYAVLEEEHEKVQSYNDLVLDGMADAVIAVDSAGTITLLNAAAEALFDKTADELVGQPYAQQFESDPVLLTQTMQSSTPIGYEEISITDDEGETRHLAVSTSLIHERDGSIASIVAMARDVTAQRRAHEQLERKDRLTAMGELAGGIAHEIRNPLNAITIIAQRFQSEFQPAEEKEEFKQLNRTIRSEVDRVNNIITQFLEFARPPQLSLERANMAVLIRNSVDVIRSQAIVKNVTLQLILDDELPVRADREKMQQVFLNLLQNALDAVENGGEIKCIACRKHGNVSVSIADNGKGIPDKTRSKIFNLYFTTKSGGSGLGLSIVHQIVSEHGGEISVTSTVGHGTTFKIILPER